MSVFERLRSMKYVRAPSSFSLPRRYSAARRHLLQRVTRRVLRLALVTFAPLAAWACSESIATLQQAMVTFGIPNTDGGIGSTGNAFNEPRSTWSFDNSGSALQETLVIGTNPSGRWHFSTNGGATFTDCNLNVTSCTGGVPFTLPMGLSINFGDPTVVSDGRGHVVFLGLLDADGDNTTPDRVYAMVSTDGGKNFASSHFRVVDDGECADGQQDQPDGYFDRTTEPPTLWVVFRHRPGIGPYGACVRRFILDSANNFLLKPIGDSFTVDNMGSETCCEGQGSVRVRAANGAVTVMYLNRRTDVCDGNDPTTATAGQAYETVTSFDFGENWTSASRLFHTDTFRNCVLDRNHTARPTLDVNGLSYDFTVAPDGTYYAVAQSDKQTIRLFMTRVPFGPGSAWREWCSATAQGTSPATSANWTLPGKFCPIPTFSARLPDGGVGSVAWPTIAADDQGRVAFWYYESDPQDAAIHVRFFGNVAPRDPFTSWQGAQLTNDFQPADPANLPINLRVLGDYAGLAVRGETPFGGGGTALPMCGDAGLFYPTWIRGEVDSGLDGAIIQRAETTRVQVTP